MSETLKNIAARYGAALRADERLSVPDEATAERLFGEAFRDIKENGRRGGNVRRMIDLLTLCSPEFKARVHRAYCEVKEMAAQEALVDVQAQVPDLPDDDAKRIVAETFGVSTGVLE